MIQNKNAKKQAAKKPSLESPARLIDARIKELDDWRGKTLEEAFKTLVRAAVVLNPITSTATQQGR